MSLATRLSAFFLIAMAVVLAGFSGTLYLLARNYLVRQLDERLQNALDTLEASVDIEPAGLEWEPADRRLTLGVDRGPTAVRWAVRDGGGAPVDLSANASTGEFPVRLESGGLAFGFRRMPRPSARSPAGGWRRGGCGSKSFCGKVADTRTTNRATRCSIRTDPGRRSGTGNCECDAALAGPDARGSVRHGLADRGGGGTLAYAGVPLRP